MLGRTVRGALPAAAVQAQRVAALAIALFDDLSARQRPVALRLGRDCLLGLADASGGNDERDGNAKHGASLLRPADAARYGLM